MEHQYKVALEWTGNSGEGTKNYTSYQRSHNISVENKPVIECSSDPAFRGDPVKHNPEEMLVASISSCHMLWFLHLCADNGIIVLKYIDNAIGTMLEDSVGGRFTEVVLHPVVTISDPSKIELTNSLHRPANKKCFIANSCNFPIRHQPWCVAG
ncbi:MAG TPA: OsmC family protein [Ferruginibacter sp.]|nr:OsmC family protein [Ferruginibacter sp.]